MPIIKTKNLVKTYNEEKVPLDVLKGLDLQVEEGEFVAIMGPSGVGKSTLLKILGLLEEKTGGTLIFNGKAADQYTEHELAQIRNSQVGFVFQSFNLLPRTDVYDNVKLPLLYSKLPEEKWDKAIRKAIRAVQLQHRIDHETSELSGGEMQRVAIARALVNNPKVIFADEPTGNLDSESGRVIMKTLQDLHRQSGHTIILITHETFIAEHAERIIKLKDGKIDSDRKNKNIRDAQNGFKK